MLLWPEAEVRSEMLADMAALKKAAMAYMHPEIPFIVTDPSATARAIIFGAYCCQVELLLYEVIIPTYNGLLLKPEATADDSECGRNRVLIAANMK
jgi:hypothetical protein